MTPAAMAEMARETLDENKAVDIKEIDVTELTDVTDYIVICTATSNRHSASLADKVERKLRDAGVRSMGTEGVKHPDGWVLIDFGDIVVHIMLAEAREFYSLEKLWGMTQAVRDKTAGED